MKLSNVKVAGACCVLLFLSGCGEAIPSCKDGAVIETIKSLILDGNDEIARSKELGCIGGCRPYFDGQNIQFHTLSVGSHNGNVRNRSAVAKLTFAIAKSDFLRAFQLTATNIRIMTKDADAQRVVCQANFKAAVDYEIFNRKIPDEIIEYEGFDGRVPMWHRQFERRTTALNQLKALYRQILWPDPLEYSVQKTADGNLYVTISP